MKNNVGGAANISSKTIKSLNDFINKPLAHVCNNCFEKGICPDHFKKAVITRVYKNAKKCNPLNYKLILI